jgi:hypothetical protein
VFDADSVLTSVNLTMPTGGIAISNPPAELRALVNRYQRVVQLLRHPEDQNSVRESARDTRTITENINESVAAPDVTSQIAAQDSG